MADLNRPAMDVRRELRFAVVLYGGVSLAVYINGVVQELLGMVRATAPDPTDPTVARFADEELTPTELVYRRLAKVLHSDRINATGPGTIYTRFIVDIVSGTSAGGINGIYLAKALAHGQQLDQLASLWIQLADMSTLLYDKQSALPHIPYDDPPPSLLNGRRMLKLLYNAFDGMDKSKAAAASRGPLVDSIDCFVTTTDIQGLPIYLSLSDERVTESWHRKFFRFRFQPKVADDFAASENPMLAFAARCTSAFPIAFEPVQIRDIVTVLGAGPTERWQRYFPEYVAPPSVDTDSAIYDVQNHAFGDGGYLDNKPFSYAIDALSAVRGTKPMDRKLIYVEPSPQHPEDVIVATADGAPVPRPTVVENTIAALTLAGQETIRDELQRVAERNQLIDRVDRILSGSDGNLSVLIAGKCFRSSPATFQERADFMRNEGYGWAAEGLQERIDKLGPSYAGFHRLKVASVTDDFANVIAMLAGFPAESDDVRAIRYLARAWRERRFSEEHQKNAPPVSKGIPAATSAPPASDARETENAFLFRFDLSFRLRRLDLTLSRLDTLSAMDDRTDRLVDAIRANIDRVMPDRAQPEDSLFARARTTWTPADVVNIQRAIAVLSKTLSTAYESLRHTQDTLTSRGPRGKPETPANALAAAVDAAALTHESVAKLLALSTETERLAYADQLVGQQWKAFDDIAYAVANRVTPPMREASQLVDTLFTSTAPDNTRWVEVRDVVRFVYDSFECIDSVTYPIRYATAVQGNLSRVDVVRISPEDATEIVNERVDRRPPLSPKLAGTALRNFGAFLNRGWRQNDLTWGRLDGAERLIKAVMAGRDPAQTGAWQTWVAEAHATIFETQVRGDAVAKATGALATAIDADQPATVPADALRDLLSTPAQLRAVYAAGTNIDRTLDRPQAATLISRASRVMGRMLDRLGTDYERPELNRGAVVLSRLGSALWGLVEVATQESLFAIMTRRWLQVLFVAELLVLAGAFLIPPFQGLRSLAITLVAVTIAIRVLITVTRVWLFAGPRWLQRALQLLAALVAAAILAGAILEFRHLGDDLRQLVP
jgi:patatin-related protein